jgi:hypothetical protein
MAYDAAKESHPVVEIIPSSQGCTGALLFLYLLHYYAKGLGDKIL